MPTDPRPDQEQEADYLGHFRLMGHLGEGGMGVVYKAFDTRLERVVALKVVSPDLLRNDQSRSRLLREARLTSALNHPNIATIHGLEHFDDTDIIVMEYVEGPTLRQRLQTGPIEVRDVLDIAIAVADALGEAHERSVIHRDIKPENIILTPRGHPKVMDFGLAKIVEPSRTGAQGRIAGAATHITAQGAALGTVAYMSPEQAAGRDVDPRSDIFSFGLVLYEMLAREAAFSGDSDVDILYEILHHDPKPISEINPDVPADVQAIVERCTRKERDERYAGGREICQDLKRARISLDIQRARTLQTLLSISREMNSILDLEPLLQRIATLVKSLIDYDMLGIFRLDPGENRLHFLGGAGYVGDKARATDYHGDRGLCGRAIRLREAVRVGDVRKDPDYYPPNGEPYISNLAVPLLHKDRVIGVLNMENRRPHFFTNEHAMIMTTLAGPIAVAIENARLFEEQRRQTRAMELLHETGHEISSILDMDFLLERVRVLTQKVIDHDLFTVFQLDRGTGTFTWRLASGYDPEFVKDRVFRLGEGVISRAVTEREAVIVSDTATDPDYIPPRTGDGRTPRSELAVPLMVGDRVNGVITLESFEPEHFSPEDARLMTVLASQIAAAMENADLYHEVQNQARAREAAAEGIRRRFESYVTPHIAEQLFRDPGGRELTGERRRVSVLVADIRGFTTVAESLPPEAVVSFLQEFFSVMTHLVFRYEGTVDKFLGDALMAFYGAPIAHDPRYGPSDPQRAVFAAMDMREAFTRLRDKWWSSHETMGGLDLCIGISTGTCVMGNMGSDKRVEYTALGLPANRAFDLCREAAPGEIRIEDRTHGEVHDDVLVEPCGDTAGGAASAPRTHRVVGLKYLT